jgi:hypothetical protein
MLSCMKNKGNNAAGELRPPAAQLNGTDGKQH